MNPPSQSDTPRLIVPDLLDDPSSANGKIRSEIGGPLKRKKVPLRPGYSLADWIKLSRLNPGIAKVTRLTQDETISNAELLQHDKASDCWIALRGKVYNVTPYLDFHPGGADEIMQAAGRDATALFNEVHAWVNYESLLRACYIAPFAGTTSHRSNLRSSGLSSTKTNSSLDARLAGMNLGEGGNTGAS